MAVYIRDKVWPPVIEVKSISINCRHDVGDNRAIVSVGLLSYLKATSAVTGCQHLPFRDIDSKNMGH